MSSYFGEIQYILVGPYILDDYQEFYFGTKKVFSCFSVHLTTHVGFSIWRPMLDSVFIIMSCTRQTQQYLAC